MTKNKKRRNRIEFRSTDYINEIVLSKIKENKYANVSEYIRTLILKDNAVFEKIQQQKAEKKEISLLRFEVKKIGVNLNQITAKINSGHFISSFELNKSLKEIKEKLEEISVKLGS